VAASNDDQAGRGLQDQLRRALSAALRSRDAEAVAALRSALAALANAEAVPAPASAAPPGASPHVAGAAAGLGAAEARRRQLSASEAHRLVAAEISGRLSAAEQYDSAGHADRAARLRREAAVLAAALGEPG
jgi:uncharacterized protein YqeY